MQSNRNFPDSSAEPRKAQSWAEVMLRRAGSGLVRRFAGEDTWRAKLTLRKWQARLGRHAVYYVITAGTDKNLGFCGHVLYALNGVRIAEKLGWIPIVNFDNRIHNHFYDPDIGDNMWDYYFEPVASLTYADIASMVNSGVVKRSQLFSLDGRDLVRIHQHDPDRVAHFWRVKPADPVEWMREKRALGRRLTQKYIRVKTHVVEKADAFTARHMVGGYIIGAHIRGTDFAYADATPLERYFETIDRLLVERPDARIFIATDQTQILALVEKRYPGRVLATECTRSDSVLAPFQLPELRPYLRGEEMLIDCLLLARCDYLLKGAAAGGEIALYFNPDLECTDFALTSERRFKSPLRKTAFETLKLTEAQSASTQPDKLHIICERDAGFFSLVQQVISHIPWALREQRIPVAFFWDRTCYWTPKGYEGRDSVWEYYFEPIIPAYAVSNIPVFFRGVIVLNPPMDTKVGYPLGHNSFASSHFGDHRDLEGKTLKIPYLWDDPDESLRREASEIIRTFVRPRSYVQLKVDQFYDEHMQGRYVLGVHIRGTDAASRQGKEIHPHRQGSLNLPKYVKVVRSLLRIKPDALILVATDAQSSLDYMRRVFGRRVITYATIRHQNGDGAGVGPLGCLMPAYIAHDRDLAARNGEEAVIEYLLLARCNHLVHNGSSLARTVLLKEPNLSHTNTHTRRFSIRSWLAASLRGRF